MFLRLVVLSLVVTMSSIGAVTAFSPDNGDDIVVDGLFYSVQNANRPWGLQNPEPGTLRFELRPGDVWYQDSPIKERTEIAGETVYAAGKTSRSTTTSVSSPDPRTPVTGWSSDNSTPRTNSAPRSSRSN